MTRRWLTPLTVAAALGVALAAAPTAGSQADPPAAGSESCPAGQGTHREVEVGIVKAVGCFTQTTGASGGTVHNAKGDVDLNGFIVTPTGPGLSIDTKTNRVWGTGDTPGVKSTVQLKSRNWPTAGQDVPLGQPVVLDFVAPATGSLVIEDFRFGSNNPATKALAGFSPVLDIETPLRIEEDGKGSMDLTVALTGYFALKGKDQSAVVRLPTESGKGTTLDGFEIKLKEIDALKVFTIQDFEASYSAAEKKVAGSATLYLPFGDNRGTGRGFGAKFGLTDGRITTVGVQAHGLKIPIGAPPGGLVTDIGGSLDVKFDGSQDVAFNGMLGAEFGPEIPTPWGNVAPIGANASLTLGSEKGEFVFKLTGGVQVFRLEVGDAYIWIYGNSGVKFGAGLGIGFPSYKNQDTDPFYIGARVDGWVSKGKFQFEGSGRVALLGAKIFDGNILVNDRAAGACWTVAFFPGGAVYQYGATEVKTFGVGCGLDAYKEKFPAAASASASRPRTIRLDDDQIVLQATGVGGPPRFTATAPDGRVYRAPTGRDSVVENDHAFFVNTTGTNQTHLFIRRPRGAWKIQPLPGSPRIVSLKAGERQPREHVEAEVRGSGAHRTLVWRSRGRANTRLIFTEKMAGGLEVPILDTDAASGRHRFKVAQGSHYGIRRLRVYVKHGYASRQSAHVDRYRVRAPRRLPAPRRVDARRDIHDVHVRWSGVRGARGYLVEVARPRAGKRQTVRYVRRVPATRRSVVFRHTAGGGTLHARVYALGADGRLGQAKHRPFAANPAVTTLREAALRSARSVRTGPAAAVVRTQCPRGGHCQVRVRLRGHGRVLASTRFQQAPDTFRQLRLEPAARRLLRRGDVEVVVDLSRLGVRHKGRGIG